MGLFNVSCRLGSLVLVAVLVSACEPGFQWMRIGANAGDTHHDSTGGGGTGGGGAGGGGTPTTKNFVFTQGTNLLHLNEIANDGTPTFKGDLPLVAAANSFEVNGTRLFIEDGNGGLSIYEIQKASGSLSLQHLSTTVATGAPGTWMLCVTPDGTSVSVVEYFSNKLHTFKVESSGSATYLGSVTTGTSAIGCTTSMDSKYVYAAAYDGSNITAYSIDPTTKVLTSIGTTASGGAGPSAIIASRDGKFIFVPEQNAALLEGFEINSSTGVITSIGVVSVCSDVELVDVDAHGHIYVGCQYGDLQHVPFNATMKTFGTPAVMPVTTHGWFSVSKDFDFIFQYGSPMDVRSIQTDGTLSSSKTSLPESSWWARTIKVTF